MGFVRRAFWAHSPTVISINARKALGTAWARNGHKMGTKQNADLSVGVF
jgi:hypothetical protein